VVSVGNFAECFMIETKIILFSYRRCPFAMRVRIALHEKGISFDIREEDLKNFSQDLRNLHPEVKVPLLLHGDRVLYESAIIAEYVDDLNPQFHPLMPKTAGEKSEVRLWTYWCNQQFKPDLDKFKYGISRFKEEDCVGAEDKVKKHLEKIEKKLETSPWLVGSDFSLADINVFPFVRQLSRIQPTPDFLKSYPRTMAWINSLSKRPSVINALQK